MPNTLDQLKQQLSDAFRRDHCVTCIALAEQILRQMPNDPLTLNRLGNSLAAISRFAEAESMLLKALEHSPDNRRNVAMSNLGHVFHLQGDHEKAIAWYRKAINANPQEASGYIDLGSTQARAGDLQEAEKSHRLATQCSNGCIDEA